MKQGLALTILLGLLVALQYPLSAATGGKTSRVSAVPVILKVEEWAVVVQMQVTPQTINAKNGGMDKDNTPFDVHLTIPLMLLGQSIPEETICLNGVPILPLKVSQGHITHTTKGDLLVIDGSTPTLQFDRKRVLDILGTSAGTRTVMFTASTTKVYGLLGYDTLKVIK